MKTFLSKIAAFINDAEGASVVEYVLLIGLIALVVTGGAVLLGPQIPRIFGLMATELAGIP
jgi:Flp pilus assembly pilin Flp